MRAFTRVGLRALVAAVSLSVASVATAQGGGPAPDPVSQGPMIVERVQTTFLVAPDFKITDVDRRTSTFVGGYAGWLNDKTLFIGGGGYWLANGNRDRAMAYGGVVVGWLGHTDQRIGFGAKTLLGVGEATLPASVTTVVFPLGDRDGRFGGFDQPPGAVPTVTTVSARTHQAFFVAEPEANMFVNLRGNFRLAAGIGYRFAGAERNTNTRLRGVSGSVALEIGGIF